MGWIFFFLLSTQLTYKVQSKQDFQGNSLISPFFRLVEFCHHNTDTASNASWESTQNWNSALVSWWLQSLIFYFLLLSETEASKPFVRWTFLLKPLLQWLKHTRLPEVLHAKSHHEQPSPKEASKTLHKRRFVAFHILGRADCAGFLPKLWYKLAWPKSLGSRKRMNQALTPRKQTP